MTQADHFKIRELHKSSSLFLCLNCAGLHGSVKPRVKPRMEATVNITCYKSKVLKDGESPLMVRICQNGKKKCNFLFFALFFVFRPVCRAGTSYRSRSSSMWMKPGGERYFGQRGADALAQFPILAERFQFQIIIHVPVVVQQPLHFIVQFLNP